MLQMNPKEGIYIVMGFLLNEMLCEAVTTSRVGSNLTWFNHILPNIRSSSFIFHSFSMMQSKQNFWQ